MVVLRLHLGCGRMHAWALACATLVQLDRNLAASIACRQNACRQIAGQQHRQHATAVFEDNGRASTRVSSALINRFAANALTGRLSRNAVWLQPLGVAAWQFTAVCSGVHRGVVVSCKQVPSKSLGYATDSLFCCRAVWLELRKTLCMRNESAHWLQNGAGGQHV